jgi:molecular chaperone GrpE
MIELLKKISQENPNNSEFGGIVRELLMNSSFVETNEDSISKYLRLLADFENYKKRIFKEKEDLVNKTKSNMLEAILDIDSDLTIACKHTNDDGIKLILSKLDKFLTSQGIEVIQTNTYDPDIHEVISVVNIGVEDEIIEVSTKGYSIGGKIIRHPKIILSK